jgi:hypothetical protein
VGCADGGGSGGGGGEAAPGEGGGPASGGEGVLETRRPWRHFVEHLGLLLLSNLPRWLEPGGRREEEVCVCDSVLWAAVA